MPADTHDFSPEELLARQVEQAYLEKDYAQVQDLLKRPDFPNAVKDTVLTTALRDGNLPLVRYVVEDAGVELSPTRAIMLVFLACQSQNLDAVLYLSEKTAQLGLERSDAYELVFSRFPAEKHAAAADELLARAGDRQDALNKMLYAAAANKAFGVIPHLLDLGADVNPNGGTDIYLMLTAYDRDFFCDRPKYLDVMRRYFEKFDDLGVLDTALTVASFKIPDNTQYPEVIGMMLDKGADPFSGHCEAQRHIVDKFNLLNAPAAAATWQETFRTAQAKDVALHRHQFDTLFGGGFTMQDLRQTAAPGGDTGFMLAAKAKVLDRVVAEAIREGANALSVDDLTKRNDRNQSLLSLAADRDDIGVLIDPAYWSKAAPGIVNTVAGNLTDEQKPFVDLPRLSSTLTQYALKQQAAKFKLKPT